MPTKFEPGDIAYTVTGRKVVVSHEDSIFPSQYHVFPIEKREDEEGNMVETPNPQRKQLAGALYKTPIVDVVAQEVVQLHEKRHRLRQEVNELYDAKVQAEEALNRVEQYTGLQHLVDYIQGRITYFVTTGGSAARLYDIHSFDEFMQYTELYGRARGIKLLTLYGDSNGDLLWGVNRYSDGSGSTTHVIPCLGYDEAINCLRDKILEALEGNENVHQYLQLVEKARTYDISLPELVMAHYHSLNKIRQENIRKRLQDAVVDAQRKLDEFEAEQKEEPSEPCATES